MSGSLNEIKTKIASTQKTSQITGAMQMVSAAKLNKSEQSAKSFQIYAQKVRQLTVDLLAAPGLDTVTNPMLLKRPVKKTGYIVITSDSGLKGGYNSSILKAVMQEIAQRHTDSNQYEIIAIGAIGVQFFRARQITPLFELTGLADTPSFQQVQEVISQSVDMYKEALFDELYVCYNHHVNTLTSRVTIEQMLPIDNLDHTEAKNGEYLSNFDLEPNRDILLNQLLPQYAESMIFGALLDAKTAENAAGMTAMRTATDNAKKVITELTMQYNRARQATITNEITEIVAGAAALE